MSTTAFFVHVPVDRLEIIDGPGARKCFGLRDQLARMHEQEARTTNGTYGCVDLPVTLFTKASATPFKRKLHVTEIFGVDGDEFQFTAVFSGGVVFGIYNMQTRKGWFAKD